MEIGHLYYELPQMKHDPYNLKGSALRVYAALYILTAKHPFTGSYRTLADWIEDISPKTVKRAVDYLVDRNLVSRDIVTNTKKPIDGIYNLDALILPEAPLPRVRYKLIMNEYQKKEKDLERKMEDYRQEKIVEGVRQNVQGVRQNVQGVGQNVPELKEKKQKKNNYNIYNKTSFLTKEVVVGDKPTAAAHQNLKKEEEEIEPYPTSLKEVLQYVREKQPGISMEVARDFFVYYSAKGWRYKNNGRVRNWKAELFLFDQRGKRWEKERAAKSFVKAQIGVSVPQAVLDLEEQMREQRRREREKADREANTPEAIAARDAFFDKFCK